MHQTRPRYSPDFSGGETATSPPPSSATSSPAATPGITAQLAAELLTIPRNAARVYLAMLRLATGDRCHATAQAIAAATAGDGDAPESERSVWRQQDALRRAGWISAATKEGRAIVHRLRVPNALSELGPEHNPARHQPTPAYVMFGSGLAEDMLCKTSHAPYCCDAIAGDCRRAWAGWGSCHRAEHEHWDERSVRAVLAGTRATRHRALHTRAATLPR
jgi:hypothetical protein